MRDLFALAESAAHLASFVWHLPNGPAEWSPQLFELVGLDPDRDDASVEAFIERLHPDDAMKMRVGLQQLLGGIAFHGAGRYRLQRDGGELRDVVVRWQVVDGTDGTPRYICGTVMDVTDALYENDRLNRVLDELARAQRLANVGSWYLDLRRNRLEWSAQLYRILGYAPTVVPSSEAWLARVHPEDLPRAALDCGPENIGQMPTEMRLVRPDGEVRWVHLEVEVTRDPEGHPIEVRGIVLDVTQRRHLEERLRESLRLETTGRLAGGVAHDFNNLLTIVQSNVERLRRAPDPQCLDDIETAVRTASELTQRLLTFGRKAVLRPRVLDLNRTIGEVIGLLRSLLPPTVQVEFRPGDALPAVRLDESQLHQVLINLITNSRDAMPNGGTVRIETKSVLLEDPETPDGSPLPAGRYVTLSVEDSGFGMSEGVRERAFEPFFTTKAPGQGTALGLATVFGIVTQSGGTIEVDSALDRGTCFRVYLPAVQPPLPLTVRTPSAPPSSVRVLLVEDNDLIREPMTFLLRDAGYEVQVAASAAEARRVWEEHEQRFDVLMTDIVMPGEHGTSLAQDLREHRPDLRVLFMTGYVDSTAPEPDARTEILQKPFRLSRPLEALQRLMAAPEEPLPQRR